MSTDTTQLAPSARRLAANRANARKSTGPRTEAGKRASAQNARKTQPCPFTFQLPPHFAAEWLHDALRRTAACPDGRARLLLINRCMLQAHELRWHAIERTLFDTACLETDGSADRASLWLAQRTSAAQGLLSYHRWIARRINRVERCLAGLAAQSAHIEEAIEAEAPKTMAAGAGGGSTFSQLSPSDLGPESTLPITYSDSGWSYGGLSGMFGIRVGAPQPPRPPRPPKPPTVGPIRGRYRLYLRCPAAPEPPNEARMSQSMAVPPPPAETHSIERSQPLSSSALERPDAQPRRREDQFEDQEDQASHPLVLREQDALTANSSMPAAIPGRTQISDPPQQSGPPLHHYPRHRRGPTPTTATPEPTPTQPQPNLSSKDSHSSRPPVPRDENTVAPNSSILESLHLSGPSQQPKLRPHHSPRHRRGPIPTTATPEPTPTQSQPNLSSKDSRPSRPPVPREENTVAPNSSILEGPHLSNPPQQPEPPHHHYPRHRRGPIPTTTTPEPTLAESQSNLPSKDSHPSQPPVPREENPIPLNSSIPGKTQISDPPQQSELPLHHSPRHRRGPIPTTTTPEPTLAESQPNLPSKDSHPSQPPVPREENSIPLSSSIPGKTQISGPPQQPELPLHHYPRHRRGPIPTTATPEPNPTQPQPNLSSKDSRPSQPTAPSNDGSRLPSMQESDTATIQPIEPNRQTGRPPGKTAHGPPEPSA